MLLRHFQVFFNIAGKKLFVPFSQQDTQEIIYIFSIAKCTAGYCFYQAKLSIPQRLLNKFYRISQLYV